VRPPGPWSMGTIGHRGGPPARRGRSSYAPYAPYALLVRTDEYVAAPHFTAESCLLRTKPPACASLNRAAVRKIAGPS
jgi:hypothetical protein